MLDLPRPSPLAADSARFAFGGVGFELLCDVPLSLSFRFARHALAQPEGADLPLAARVQCRVQRVMGPLGEPVPGIRITRDSADMRIASDELRAVMRPTSAGHFRVDAQVAGLAKAADALALGVSAAAVERCGGLHLHAAAIELDGRAVLFIGPSGSGKSTAVTLTRGARALAFDRACLLPRDGHYVVWSLPGGAPVAAPWSARRVLPLGAIVRVRKGSGRPRLAPLNSVRGVFALRESVGVSGLGLDDEERRLAAVLALSGAAPVAELHSVLGVDHAELLRELMGRAPAVAPSGAAVRNLGSHARL